MSLPAYSRARALAARLRETMPKEAFQSLCLYNAESHVILQALEASQGKSELSQMKLYPCVVPERGASKETMDAALATLQKLVEQKQRKKAWWKFW